MKTGDAAGAFLPTATTAVSAIWFQSVTTFGATEVGSSVVEEDEIEEIGGALTMKETEFEVRSGTSPMSSQISTITWAVTGLLNDEAGITPVS
jgi:hypothetical protein